MVAQGIQDRQRKLEIQRNIENQAKSRNEASKDEYLDDGVDIESCDGRKYRAVYTLEQVTSVLECARAVKIGAKVELIVGKYIYIMYKVVGQRWRR